MSEDIKRRLGVFTLPAAALAAAVLGAVALADYIHSDLVSSRRAPETNSRYLVGLLDDHAARTLDAADLVLRLAADNALKGGMPAVVDSAESLSELAVGAPYLDNLYITDSRGRALFDARRQVKPGAHLSDREWVRALLSDKASEFVIGRAMFDPTTQNLSFPVARSLKDESGEIVGLAAAAIPTGYFHGFQIESEMGGHTVLGISRMDAVSLVRLPSSSWEAAGSMAADPLFTEHLPLSSTGTYWTKFGDAEAAVSYRKLDDRGLVVWLGIVDPDALAAHNARSRYLILGYAAVCSAFGALIFMLVRKMRIARKAAAELETANQELMRSNADLEQFAYVASHDLKEPLRNIASYVQLLQRRYQGNLDADADAFIGYTVDGVRRMQVIINDLLAYSRIGLGPGVSVPVQLGVLVAGALGDCKTMIAEAGAVVDVKGPLPVVVGDPGQLSSVVLNLIANALKYRREDVRPEVTVSARELPDGWRIDVADNGIGIEAAHHEQIFDLFKRLHGRGVYSGTGIGLAVCRRVIERHNGRIWVSSTPGAGSVFSFVLPKPA